MYDEPVSPVRLINVVVNAGSVEIWSPYELAPETVDQFTVGRVGIPDDPSAGEFNAGIPGATVVTVVNRLGVVHAPVPLEFAAFIRQKYVVPYERGDVNDAVVPVIADRLTVVVPKAESVETCSPYEVAPVTAFQMNAVRTGMELLASAGETRTGAAGMP